MLARLPSATSNMGRTRNPSSKPTCSISGTEWNFQSHSTSQYEANNNLTVLEFSKMQNNCLQDVGRLTFVSRRCFPTKVASHLVSLYQSESPKGGEWGRPTIPIQASIPRSNDPHQPRGWTPGNWLRGVAEALSLQHVAISTVPIGRSRPSQIDLQPHGVAPWRIQYSTTRVLTFGDGLLA